MSCGETDTDNRKQKQSGKHERKEKVENGILTMPREKQLLVHAVCHVWIRCR